MGDTPHGDVLASRALIAAHPNCVHRPTEPSRKYNCHGMTFAARRTWIANPNQVQMILIDDNYEEVAEPFVVPGDIIIYSSAGDIEHSGIVILRDELKALHVLSKWGFYHEVVHKVPDCPYSDCERITYHRIRR
jgi:hypothetical protein